MKLIRSAKTQARLSQLHRDERGLSTVEYVILLALIAVGAIGVWSTFGGKIIKHVGDANTEFENLEPTP